MESKEQWILLQNSLNEMNSKLDIISLNHSLPEILSNDDLIKSLGISRRIAFEWRKTRVIKFSQIGNKIFYLREDVLDMMKEHQVNLAQKGNAPIIVTATND